MSNVPDERGNSANALPTQPQPVRRAGAFRTSARLLGQCMKGEMASTLGGMALMLIGSLVGLLQPWPLKFIVDAVTTKNATPGFLTYAQNLLEHLLPIGMGKSGLITLLCIALVVIGLLGSAISVLSTWMLISAGLRMVFKLRCQVFEHIQRLELGFHDATTVGDSLYRITWDTYSVQSLFNQGLVPGISAAVTLVGISVVMVSQDWSIGAVALVVGLLLLVLIRRLEKPTTDFSTRVHENESLVSTCVQQTLTGIRAVQAFGGETYEAGRFAHQARRSLVASLRLTVLQTASQSGVALLLAVGTATVIWMAAERVVRGQLSPGDVVLLAGYTALLFKPLETLSYTVSSIQGAVAGAHRVFKILDRNPAIADKPSACPLPPAVCGEIRFDHLFFRYRDDTPVLEDIDLTIPAGTSVAFVGSSGAGKSTLASLILRFYDPQRGTVFLDDRPLQDITLESLRQQITMVPQEPVLFDVSIRENIAYSKPDAKRDEVEGAARAAGAWDFIVKLPQGFDTPVGERGVLLSGGQRQRLSLARAFLKNAPIVILDEPTTGLDAQTEADLLQTMRTLMAGRTTIVISHHLGTVRYVNKIVVLDNSTIRESGTHAELFAAGGLYRKLHDLQFHEQSRPTGAP